MASVRPSGVLTVRCVTAAIGGPPPFLTWS
jgi:hypothetical protein